MTVTRYTSYASVVAILPTGASFSESTVNALLDVLQSRIDSFMGEPDWFFTKSDVTVTEDGTGTSVLLFVNEMRPIIEVSAVTVTDEDLTDLTGLTYDPRRHILFWDGGIFSKGVRNVVLTADVGYATVPSDVAQAMAEACVRILRAGGIGSYLEMRGGAGNVEQVKIEDAVVKFGKGSFDSSARIIGGTGDRELDSVLARYKYRYAIGGFAG